MSSDAPSYVTSRIEASDAKSGFRCGSHPLDDYFKRHAVPNDVANIGRTYVLRRGPADDAGLPLVRHSSCCLDQQSGTFAREKVTRRRVGSPGRWGRFWLT